MSIIYDALKKSQRSRLARKSSVVAKVLQPSRKHLAFTLLSISGLTLLVITYILGTYTTEQIDINPPPPPTIKPVAVKAFKAPHLSLDGVFLSDKEKLAMINRRTYHLGDEISGMKITKISLEKVVLKGKTHSIVLQNSLAAQAE